MNYMLRFLKIVFTVLFICIPKANAQLFGGQLKNSLVSRYPIGSVFCESGPTAIVDVTNSTTGKTWMDRNLGASRVATSSSDALALGDLYQWGRRSDGHQCRSNTQFTNTLSSVDQPTHNKFISSISNYNDWRNPQNANLWQGINGINNPCPIGYRIPTATELDNERMSWSANNSTGSFNSPLKLPKTGCKENANDGDNIFYGARGLYWSSDIIAKPSFATLYYSNLLSTRTSGAEVYFNKGYDNLIDRANGFAVRCIKETIGVIGSLDCANSTITGNLTSGQIASNVSVSVPYTGGNSGFYISQSIASTNVLGLTADLSSGLLASGSGNLTLVISGTPSSVGTASFALNVGGQRCTVSILVQAPTSGYGADITDVESNTYKTVYIGTQQWMAENLKVSKYSDGTTIPNITDNTQWSQLTTGAWVYYNNDLANNAKYGKLYNWYAVSKTTNGNKNVCPTGWHVPTDAEWTVLTVYLGGVTVAGGKMKEIGTTSWNSPNAGATNTSLFTGLPGGYRYSNGNYYVIGNYGFWWSSTELNTLDAWYRNLRNNDGNAYRLEGNNKRYGLSVRCLKD
jgi:uncharacterized protein (TIGR02145 family)